MASGAARTLIETGSPEPLGSCLTTGGVNFAVYAPAAKRMELCLFDAGNDETRLDLPANTDGIWHGLVPDLTAGQRYGFRAHGAYAPEQGTRFNPHKLLLDPYARGLAGTFTWSEAVFDYRRADTTGLVPSEEDSASYVPKSVVTAPSIPATHVAVPWSDMLIYELNVRGFSMRHPAIDPEDRGRLTGLGSTAVIGHLRALGVTSVELMPIHAFIDEEFLVARRLRNFWGYNSLGFFAVEPRYLGPDGLDGVRRAIDTLHDAGIEVILDVVYNHTAEGGRLGPTLSFRGLANDIYYRLEAGNPAEYVNDTGCGNTLDTSEPIVRRLIVDSLRYWVESLGVDGFRFDLATVLGRTAEGFEPNHALFEDIRDDDLLTGVKLIAEPWDVGPDGYRLGAFPPGWAEWNDQFRDTVRRFWSREPGLAPDLARRIHGSSDIFEPGGRGPDASINFVTSHDGFTLLDLVSYRERHNEANCEDNRDGHRDNFSVNHGVEGPTPDETITAMRRRHRLNLLATVLFSQGTPMLLAGDEFGNTQSGNNNAYAQDNETGWLDWKRLGQDPEFFDEVCSLTAIRRELPLLRQVIHRHGDRSAATGRPDIVWFGPDGEPIPPPEWPITETLGMLLSREDESNAESDPVDAVAVLFSVAEHDMTFRLPSLRTTGAWYWKYSSAGTPQTPIAGRRLVLTSFSVACLAFETGSPT